MPRASLLPHKPYHFGLDHISCIGSPRFRVLELCTDRRSNVTEIGRVASVEEDCKIHHFALHDGEVVELSETICG